MKELNYIQPKEIKIESLDKIIKVKSYLTVDEISEIVKSCKDLNPIDRDIFMYAMVIDKCTDLVGLVEHKEDTISIDTKLYDLYKMNGVIEQIINEIDEKYIYEIEDYIAQFNSVNQTVKNLSSDIEKLLEKANNALQKASSKGFDLKSVIEQLKEVNNG